MLEDSLTGARLAVPDGMTFGRWAAIDALTAFSNDKALTYLFKTSVAASFEDAIVNKVPEYFGLFAKNLKGWNKETPMNFEFSILKRPTEYAFALSVVTGKDPNTGRPFLLTVTVAVRNSRLLMTAIYDADPNSETEIGHLLGLAKTFGTALSGY